MKQAVQIVGYVNLVVFTVLAVATLLQWRRRRSTAAMWAALSFGALGVVVLLGRAVPEHPGSFGSNLTQRFLVAVLAVFPYLLYRFTLAFGRSPRRLALAVGSMTAIIVVWTFALPHFPEPGERRSGVFWAYLVAFVIHWSVLSILVAARLWRAGRRQPTVAHRRMQMLALAATALTLAIVLAASTRDQNSGVALASGIGAFVSGVAFLLGLVPPPSVRILWRRAEQERIDEAIAGLVSLATTPQELASRMLEPAAAVVGARAIALCDEEGNVIAEHEAPRGTYEHPDAEPIRVPMPSGSLVVWTTPYAPYFGSEELALLRTLGTLTGVALDRVRLFTGERAARIELERANQMKANFVALAAHELRTPATTIYGFAETLDRLYDRLPEERRRELRGALAHEAERLARLVEQLLDLSRLDADAIPINPCPIDVRERLEQVVATAAAEEPSAVRLNVPEGLEAVVDPEAFERIVANLVTNAMRYGQPPIVVAVEQSDRHLRVAVEDRGRGVAPDFVPDLFERFTRSDPSRSRRSGGTGLGLAIARSYARAHDGDLFYSPAEPHGARFELVLPSLRMQARGADAPSRP